MFHYLENAIESLIYYYLNLFLIIALFNGLLNKFSEILDKLLKLLKFYVFKKMI